MIQFKDPQGNIVTPQRGDYVMASDIASGEKQKEVIAAFVNSGASVPSHWYTNPFFAVYFKWSTTDNEVDFFNWIERDDARQITVYTSSTKPTLFEAAKDAPDGTMFELKADSIDGYGSRVFVKEDCAIKDRKYGRLVTCLDFLARTDFEFIPSGPVKAFNLTDQQTREYKDACLLIGELMKWPGAQIGKPGWTIGDEHEPFVIDANPLKTTVTYKDKQQAEAAYRAECPELFK